eukprot:scaffold415_cov362-Prasinococcus_capsulatus_cf.AAC.15
MPLAMLPVLPRALALSAVVQMVTPYWPRRARGYHRDLASRLRDDSAARATGAIINVAAAEAPLPLPLRLATTTKTTTTSASWSGRGARCALSRSQSDSPERACRRGDEGAAPAALALHDDGTAWHAQAPQTTTVPAADFLPAP